MKINESNKQRIHDVLITDLQRLMFKMYNTRKDTFSEATDEDYDNQNTILYSDVAKCNTVQDINNLLIEYKDLFENDNSQLALNNVFTLDGTLNYIFKLLR